MRNVCIFVLNLLKMKRVLTISYWLVAVILVAAIIRSLGYRFGEAALMGTLFCPCALFVKYYFSKYPPESDRTYIRNTVFVFAGVLVIEFLLVISAHSIILDMRAPRTPHYTDIPLPGMLSNPFFISLVIASLAVGAWLFEFWLEKKFPASPAPVTFLSDRRSVTLNVDEIMYVESNDSFTVVCATEGRRYHNKTPISQWESILSRDFVRTHRSYIVNRSFITEAGPDCVRLGEIVIPISKKYRNCL